MKKLNGMSGGKGIGIAVAPVGIPVVVMVVGLILARLYGVKVSAIFLFLVLMVYILRVIADRMLEEKHRKAYEEILQRKKWIRKMFCEKYKVPEILEIAEDVDILDEAVEENRYEHTLSTNDISKWGVYVGKFFVHCKCTADTFKCVELLRKAGVPVAVDERCLYEKKEVEGEKCIDKNNEIS